MKIFLSSEEYRSRVVSFVKCPKCNAAVDEVCSFGYDIPETTHPERRTVYDLVQEYDPRTEKG